MQCCSDVVELRSISGKIDLCLPFNAVARVVIGIELFILKRCGSVED